MSMVMATVDDDDDDMSPAPPPLSEASPAGSVEAPEDTKTEDELAEWTFLVFINGDNNLESAALIDVNELEKVGSTDEVNLLVQLDRSAGQSTDDGDWTGARRYRIERNQDPWLITSPVAEDLGAVDSGDPQTVVDFVAWGVENYPSERVALVIWNHGWGWSLTGAPPDPKVKGISSDYDTGNDISVAEGEMESMLADGMAIVGKPFDLIGMDACLMGNWEIAHAVAPYGETYVASQDYVSLDGWPYDTLADDLVADPTMDGAALGEAIALRFWESGDTAKSVIDLGAMDALQSELDAFAEVALASEDADDALYRAADGALGFEWGGDPNDRDLGHLMARIDDTTLQPYAEAVGAALDEAVIANHTNGDQLRDATGLSIYAPVRGELSDSYLEATWSEDTLWDEVVVAYFGD